MISSISHTLHLNIAIFYEFSEYNTTKYYIQLTFYETFQIPDHSKSIVPIQGICMELQSIFIFTLYDYGIQMLHENPPTC